MKIDLTRLIARDAEIIERSPDSATLRLGASGGGVTMPEVRECGLRYVIGDAEVLEDHSAAMLFRCFTGGDEPKIYMRFGLLPRFKTRLCLDLDLLDNRTIYTPRTPGMLKLVVHGHRVERDDVERFELGVAKVFHDVTVRLTDFYMSDEPPEEFPIPDVKLVDEFGQWKNKEWPGKVHSFEELKSQLHSLEGDAVYPFPTWNRWGGDASRKIADGTGFFAAKKTSDGRWHLVDPDGCDYFSLGPCCATPGDPGRVDSFEKTCDWLPLGDDNYAEFFRTRTYRRMPYMPEETQTTVSFTGLNLKRVYGDEWHDKWEEISLRALKGSGMNSQGNVPGISVNNGRGGLPYVRQLPGFPMTKTLIFRDFPDVLSPEYRENAERFAKTCGEWRDDPWLIGYFLRNEPEFNFVEGIAVADEVLRCPEKTYCRAGLIEFLRGRYGDITALNAAWGSGFASFDDLEAPIDACSSKYPGSEGDIREYSQYLIREYIRVPAEACRRADPNHLDLGLRWSKANNPDMMVGWEYIDVFSINCYDFDPTEDMDFVKNAGVDRPILLGEFHCGALDRGLTATGLKGVTNQTERAKMWRRYVENAAAHPYGVGAHWFQMNDQFCLGRFDGENYQIGVFDVCMLPSRELVDASRESAAKLYALRNGEAAPFDEAAEVIPMIGY